MKISVIIPVYNAENTLRRCVDSLLVQRNDDVEIVLVNDGSTDGSEAICKEYARRNKNICCITQRNAGVSAARNTGLDAAKGDYILFVDSDDYVLNDYFSTIERLIEDGCEDWIWFSVCFDDGAEKYERHNKPFSSHSREELMPQIADAICRKRINGPWAKVYKREIIDAHHIRFPVGASVAEDRAFNIVYSYYIQSLVDSESIGYVVMTDNENSLSRKRHSDLKEQFDIAAEYMERELISAPIPDEEKRSYRQAINFGFCRGIYHDAKLMIQDRTGWFTRQKRLFQLCRSINKKHMKYPNTRYCRLITLPVRLYLTPVIDAAAIKLTRGT